MKRQLVLIFFLLPSLLFGQAKITDSIARLKLNDLIENWTLGIDSTTDVVDIRIYNKFKNLFDLNATVQNGFDVYFQYTNEQGGAYKVDGLRQPFDEYAHHLALQLRNMRLDSVAILDSNTADSKNIRYRLALTVEFQKPRKYVLPDDYVDQVLGRRRINFEKKDDTVALRRNLDEKLFKSQDSLYRFRSRMVLQVEMAGVGDSILITAIQLANNDVVSINDADFDAVLNQEDSLNRVFGDFTANGRPDYDLDGEPNATDKCRTTFGLTNQGCPPSYFLTNSQIEVFIGVQSSTPTITLPELNQLGYVDPSGADAMDVLQSRKGQLRNPGRISGFYSGGNYTLYLGQDKKKSGVSLGFAYTKFSGAYELTEPIVYTFKANDGRNFYRRQITISQLNEEMDFTVMNVPLLFSYRFHLDRRNKSVINLKAGPSFLLFKNVSAYGATIDFGGLYQIDTVTKDKITYYDYYNPTSKYNILFTTASINAGNRPGTSADSVFRQLALKNYDFASNKNVEGTQDISRSTFAFNFEADLQQKISEGFTIKAGATLLYAPSIRSKGKYKPVDNTTDEFQSIYNSNIKTGFRAVGLRIGVVYDL